MIGKKIKELRKKNGLTQSELATMINVSDAYIGMLENGKRTGGVKLLQDISEIFNISLSELTGQEETSWEERYKNLCDENKQLKKENELLKQLIKDSLKESMAE